MVRSTKAPSALTAVLQHQRLAAANPSIPSTTEADGRPGAQPLPKAQTAQHRPRAQHAAGRRPAQPPQIIGWGRERLAAVQEKLRGARQAAALQDPPLSPEALQQQVRNLLAAEDRIVLQPGEPKASELFALDGSLTARGRAVSQEASKGWSCAELARTEQALKQAKTPDEIRRILDERTHQDPSRPARWFFTPQGQPTPLTDQIRGLLGLRQIAGSDLMNAHLYVVPTRPQEAVTTEEIEHIGQHLQTALVQGGAQAAEELRAQFDREATVMGIGRLQTAKLAPPWTPPPVLWQGWLLENSLQLAGLAKSGQTEKAKQHFQAIAEQFRQGTGGQWLNHYMDHQGHLSEAGRRAAWNRGRNVFDGDMGPGAEADYLVFDRAADRFARKSTLRQQFLNWQFPSKGQASGGLARHDRELSPTQTEPEAPDAAPGARKRSHDESWDDGTSAKRRRGSL